MRLSPFVLLPVTRLFSMFKPGRIQPPVRRVLAIDAGSRCLKLLLAESDFGRLRILKEDLIDLKAEGLVSADEMKEHLQAILEHQGKPALALVLPQHLSISQVIDLPLAPENEVKKLIEDETIKLSGVSETRMVYDFVRVLSPPRNRQQFWVTFCQEREIRERILRLGLEQEDICDVTTTANALIAAFRATSPDCSRAILVHMGAQTTVVVILLAAQGAFAASFQMGGDFLTRSLARLNQCSEEAAEALKRKSDLLNGPEACPGFAEVVDGWAAELKRQLNDWFEHKPALAAEVNSFVLVASGGGFEQPGLLEYLAAHNDLRLQQWPSPIQSGLVCPSKRFKVAFGAALQALGYSAQPVSLLPQDFRLVWKKRLARQRFEAGSVALALVCALLFAFGTWHSLSLLHRKASLLDKVKAAHEAVQANQLLNAELATEYEAIRPLFQAQQTTLDTLRTLNLLQQSRSNRSLWFVLLADQQTYFSQLPAALTSTNKPAKTNVVTAITNAPPPLATLFAAGLGAAPNTTAAKPGLIAELCVPEEAEAARAVLSQLVNHLKQQPLFAKADLLSDDLRRSLADPRLVIQDRHFVLALDFSNTEFQQPVSPRKGSSGPPPRGPRRSARPPWAFPEAGDKSAVFPP